MNAERRPRGAASVTAWAASRHTVDPDGDDAHPARCPVCGFRLDPVVVAEGWDVHPCCEPGTDCRSAAEMQRAANRAYRRAVRSGRLVPADDCAHCGVAATSVRHAGHHHRGYGRGHELDVIWLCPSCHARAHRSAT